MLAIEVEQHRSLEIYKDLKLNGSEVTPQLELHDGHPLILTLMPLPDLNTPYSTSTRRSLDNLSKELLCSLTNDAREEYSQVERRQPFRIEIPLPPQDW